LLEELAQRYDLPSLLPLTKWGTWQKHYPRIGCGLKRGFTFYHHESGQAWQSQSERRNELLVAASPHDEIADTHWYRPDFDSFLVGEAQRLGAKYFDRTQMKSANITADSVHLSGERDSKPVEVRARFVIDASGPRGFLHRALGVEESSFARFPDTQALFAHFKGVKRWDASHDSGETPPYPVDDAALHHVFEGGWIWVLRFNNGITSAGAALSKSLAEEIRIADGPPAWDRLLARLPSVREQFAAATACTPFVHSPKISFRSQSAAGERWAMLPSAAGFVDPLLSTGFPLALLGIERLMRLVETEWESPALPSSLQRYSSQTLDELDTAAALVDALYPHLGDFEVFTALTQIYFAAAMFAETERRLGRNDGKGSFLMQHHPQFGPASKECFQRASKQVKGKEQTTLLRDIAAAITPINVGGLANPARRNWYPARAEDLLEAASKLGVGRNEILALLVRCGFTPPARLKSRAIEGEPA
jgi:tetracycline 7-halogenase / FADH2 O2-dependent halogenase